MAWQYFSEDELKCRCGCGKANMNPNFMKKLIALRDFLDFPLKVTSAYRCSDYNEKVSTTGSNGPHTTGRAIDIAVFGNQAFNLMRYAPCFEFHGLGVKQNGPHNQRFIHIDDLIQDDGSPRPWVWGY